MLWLIQLRKWDKCPECGNVHLVQQEGCTTCYSCGWSVCS